MSHRSNTSRSAREVSIMKAPLTANELEEAVELLKFIDVRGLEELDPSLQTNFTLFKKMDVDMQV